MEYAETLHSSRLECSLPVILLLAAFAFLLGRSLELLPVGTAHAVWTCGGAVGTVLMGVALFGEWLDPLRLSGIAIVVRALPS